MNIFITGITGTLGTALAKLHRECGDAVYGCARNDAVICRWEQDNPSVAVQVFHRDARDLIGLLTPEFFGCRVYHCAALKHVDVAERDPEAAVKQNLDVTIVVLDACNRARADLVFVSTDKAASTQNVYAMTKRLAEMMVLAQNHFVVRLGNLIGSSASVFERWGRCLANGESLPVTDPEMTRFFIAPRMAAAIMRDVAGREDFRGLVVVPCMRSVCIGDVATQLGNVKVIGRRPGETQHEVAVRPGEYGTIHLLAELMTGFVLGCGSEHPGYNSLDAERWNIDELIQEADIQPVKRGIA